VGNSERTVVSTTPIANQAIAGAPVVIFMVHT